MSNAANDVIRAFITAFSANDGHVVLRQRGGSPGYVHIVPSGFDPKRREDRHLIVELARIDLTRPFGIMRLASAQGRTPDDSSGLSPTMRSSHSGAVSSRLQRRSLNGTER